MTLKIKQHDDGEGVFATLKRNGKEVDLTNALVTFRMGHIKGEAEILNAEKGEVYFPLYGEATKNIGLFKAEFKVKKDGLTRTYPNKGFIDIEIVKGV